MNETGDIPMATQPRQPNRAERRAQRTRKFTEWGQARRKPFAGIISPATSDRLLADAKKHGDPMDR